MVRVLFLPILAGCVMFTTMLVCYIVEVLYEGANPFLETISWAGIYLPTASVFSWGLNLYACLNAIIFYIKYKQFELDIRRQRAHLSNHRINIALSVIGAVALLALTVLGNFQMKNEDLQIHNVSAGICFPLMVIYSWLHQLLTYRLQRYNAWWIFRLILAIIVTIAFVCMVVFLILFGVNDDSKMSWLTDLCEYALALGLVTLMMTLAADFRGLTVELTLLDRKSNNGEALLIDNSTVNTM